MAYAIIETGGKQLRVEPGRFYDIELLSTQPDETITIQSVLLVQHNGEVTIGQPLVAGATVEGTVMRHFRGRKVLVYKMKPKKKTRKKRGHRQEITRLMINSISLNGSVFSAEEAATAEPTEAIASPDIDNQSVETATEPVETQTGAAIASPEIDTQSVETATETGSEIATETENQSLETATDYEETQTGAAIASPEIDNPSAENAAQ